MTTSAKESVIRLGQTEIDILDPDLLARIAATLAAAALLIALVSEQFGWKPCELCLWQRYPYYFGLALAAPALFWGIERRWLYAGAAVIFAIGVGLAFYHTLVELQILKGLESCGAETISRDRSFEDFLAETENEVIVNCGARTPFFLGLTMTNLNLVVSMDIAALFALAAWRQKS